MSKRTSLTLLGLAAIGVGGLSVPPTDHRLVAETLPGAVRRRPHAREVVDWFERLGMKPDYAEAKTLFDRLEGR